MRQRTFFCTARDGHTSSSFIHHVRWKRGRGGYITSTTHVFLWRPSSRAAASGAQVTPKSVARSMSLCLCTSIDHCQNNAHYYRNFLSSSQPFFTFFFPLSLFFFPNHFHLSRRITLHLCPNIACAHTPWSHPSPTHTHVDIDGPQRAACSSAGRDRVVR